MNSLPRVGQLGRLLFSLSIIGIGIETCIGTRALEAHSRIVPVIPWIAAIPPLGYLLAIVFVSCGVGLLFQRPAVISAVVLGIVMVVCGLAFDVPRHPDLMSAPWRTNVLEPIVIGCLAWLLPEAAGVPTWLRRVSRYAIGLSLIIFGIGHFQILKMIAAMVPYWMPGHWLWTVFFGFAFLAAGFSLVTGFLQRWAAFGTGLMFALFTLAIHLPSLIGAPRDPDKWSDVLIVVALWGGFWAVSGVIVSATDDRNRSAYSRSSG